MMLRWSSLFLSVFIILLSCGSSIPDLEKTSPHASAKKMSISYLKSLYTGIPTIINSEMKVEGFVTSSDRYGNIYKTVHIEDSTGGLAIKIDSEELFEMFPLGSYVSVYCNSLYLGDYGGMIQLGTKSEDGMSEVGHITETKAKGIAKFITAPTEPALPYVLEFKALSQRYVACRVEFIEVQFVDEEVGKSWSEPQESTDRHLINRDGDTLVVRTNHRSLFANRPLPINSGRIEGILSYFNRTYQLLVTTPHDAIMESDRFSVAYVYVPTY